jgi:predicted Zn-dependent protease
MKQPLPSPPALLLCAFLLSGCAAAVELSAKVGATMGEFTGVLSDSQADAIRRSSEPLAKSFEDVTPEQEHYLGRAVAAEVAARYPAWNDEAANRYVTLVGTALARESGRPETYGGYHFQVLDSEEVNAFAAPGGFIFVTRGMLRLCTSEEEAAAVLAHEIAHVELAHGLKAVKQSRLTTALTILAVEGAKSAGGGRLAEVTSAFEDSISDISHTLFTSGYSRESEYEADRTAARTLTRLGYGADGLPALLHVLERRIPADRAGFASTHPAPEDRITELAAAVSPEAAVPFTPNALRESRFRAALGAI